MFRAAFACWGDTESVRMRSGTQTTLRLFSHRKSISSENALLKTRDRRCRPETTPSLPEKRRRRRNTRRPPQLRNRRRPRLGDRCRCRQSSRAEARWTDASNVCFMVCADVPSHVNAATPRLWARWPGRALMYIAAHSRSCARALLLVCSGEQPSEQRQAWPTRYSRCMW